MTLQLDRDEIHAAPELQPRNVILPLPAARIGVPSARREVHALVRAHNRGSDAGGYRSRTLRKCVNPDRAQEGLAQRPSGLLEQVSPAAFGKGPP